MKKLFVVLAIASLGFVACNNDSNSTEEAAKATADSARIADSLKAKAAQDSAAAAAMTPVNDSTGKKDTATKK